tara:strand:+ start:3143 stop:4108 length:966 start_codon:yes stop_codon:yes gene_type:complete
MTTLTDKPSIEELGPADWVLIALRELSSEKNTVLVMITEHAGSTPRNTGAWMLVGNERTYGTLGGGQLEKIAEEEAKKMLASHTIKKRSKIRCLLGPDAQQCCGGAVNIVLELLNSSATTWLREAEISLKKNAENAVAFQITEPNITPKVISVKNKRSKISKTHLQSLVDSRRRLFLFGAGHVGHAICSIALQLPIRVYVIDERSWRRDLIPKSNNVSVFNSNQPETIVSQITDNSFVLVMTHSHELDYQLCRALIKKNTLDFIGLIGSRSKASRFRHRLCRDGVDPKLIEKLNCPIGKAGPSGKEPGMIALATLSEIMQS